jgi:hypothetical protein
MPLSLDSTTPLTAAAVAQSPSSGHRSPSCCRSSSSHRALSSHPTCVASRGVCVGDRLQLRSVVGPPPPLSVSATVGAASRRSAEQQGRWWRGHLCRQAVGPVPVPLPSSGFVALPLLSPNFAARSEPHRAFLHRPLLPGLPARSAAPPAGRGVPDCWNLAVPLGWLPRG